VAKRSWRNPCKGFMLHNARMHIQVCFAELMLKIKPGLQAR